MSEIQKQKSIHVLQRAAWNSNDAIKAQIQLLQRVQSNESVILQHIDLIVS